jgi:hypothetical protein
MGSSREPGAERMAGLSVIDYNPVVPGKPYCVYEAVNQRLGEAVVGVTDSDELAPLKQRHTRLPPVWMCRWDARDVEYKIVQRRLAIREAFTAASAHAAGGSLARLSVHVIG